VNIQVLSAFLEATTMNVPPCFRSSFLSTVLMAGFALLCLGSPGIAQTNLALGKTATASSTQAGAPNNVTDANMTSRWGSNYNNTEWIYIDLGSSQTVNKVTLQWQSSYGTAYKIETSPDSSVWTEQASLTGQNGGQDDIIFSSVSARYVRMLGVTRKGSYGYSLYEFEIYNTGGPVPVITSATTQTGTAGTALTYQIAATNSPTSFAATGLPAGLTVNPSTGLISGTPAAAGTPTATITATNANGPGSASLTFNIATAMAVPVITSSTTASGTAGTPFTYQISATNNPTSYGATGLPAGLSLNPSTGLISGTPTTAGTPPTATITATNAGGTGAGSLDFTIAPAPVAPSITSPAAASGVVGAPFAYQIAATNNPTSYGATGLPAGLSLNPSTGLISGTPTAAATTSATLTASNSGGPGTAPLDLTFTAVADVNLALNLPASASSFQTGNEVAKGNDGSTATRWCALAGTFPQWWQVDLGANKILTKMDIAWYLSATRSYKYKIEVSTDNANYTLVADKTTNTTFGDTSDTFSASARYVRVTVTGSSTGYASAYEFKVFGPGNAIRVVASDAKVQSRKRGVAMNSLSAADFQALAPGVSWYYNWGNNPGTNVPPANAPMTYYPMAFGNTQGYLNGLSSYLASVSPKPPVILGINEPNLRGQSFINPQTTASLFAQIKAIGDQYGIPVVGPQMASGSAAGDSIVADDPYLGPNYTYTFMVPFLDATLYYAGQAGTPVPSVSFHGYGNLGELKYFTQLLYDTYQRPVWVTEFAYWDAPDATAARDYLIQATDYLERTPFVAGYAWFKERSTTNTANISLLVPAQSGVLSTLGQNYVALPTHDADLYYRLPGRLPAENYVAMVGCDLRATTDAIGGFDLTLSGTPSADFNVQVDTARYYTVQFRIAGAGTVTLSRGGTTLTTVTTTLAGWQTVSATIPLTAVGPQTLRITRTGSVSAINWIEFQ
jgi:hypothetical protein